MTDRRWTAVAAALIVALAAAPQSAASPCSEWEWINPVPQGNVLLGVAYGNATWVAVGDVGTVLTSPDGTNPVVRSPGTSANLDGVVWTGSQFIAVGQSILTSPDGISWTERVTGTAFNDVAWGGSLAVAVGNSGAISTSLDGVNWTAQVSGTTIQLYGVTWGGGLYVAVGAGDGDGGTILTSPDAITWTRQTSGTLNALRSVAWSGTRYVAVGDHANGADPSMLSSTDGVAWTVENPGTTRSLRDVTWTGSQFVVVGFLVITTSPDGIAWATQTTPSSVLLFSVASGPSASVMGVGDAGQVMTSPDGVTWTDQVFDITLNSFDGVAWSGSEFVAVGRYVVHSPDGFSWSVTDPDNAYAVAWNGALWLAVGWDGRVISSPDGITWTTETSGTTDALWDVVWGDAQFVAVGENGTVLTSTDGMSWTAQTSGAAVRLTAVTWNGMLYVAVGHTGTILTSPDAVTWTDRSQATTNQLNDVCWTGTGWVVVGGGTGTVFTSEDGVTWENHSFFAASSLGAVAWNGIEVTTVTPGGAVWTSPDGETWTEEPSPTTYQLRTMVAVGSDLWVLGNKSNIHRRHEVACEFGDAPDPTYPTLLAADGARHFIAGPHLGAHVDGEDDGQPTAGAEGDDTDADGDDEDGVVFTSALIPGESGSVDVDASEPCLLSAWVDFNLDGDWAGAGEQVFANRPLAAGVNPLDFAVPAAAVPAPVTFARFRVSSAGGLSYTGEASDGEVEDHAVSIEALDYGDAPDPMYPTLRASDGARHVVSGLWLGAAVDGEPDGQPTSASDGDDLAGIDDEDGVDLPSSLLAGAVESVDVTASAAGLLSAWVDFDSDGDWLDAGEQVLADQPLVAGVNTLPFAVPLNAEAGATVARFRLSSAGELAPTGLALDGEVEDHAVTVEPSAELELTVSDDPDPVPDGDAVTYFLRMVNNGTLEATGVTLSNTLPVGVVFAGSVPGSPTCTEAAGVVTCDLGTAPAGAWIVVKVTVDVPGGASGVLTNTASVTLNEEDPVPANNSAIEDTAVVDDVDHVYSGGFETGDFGDWQVVTGG